MNLRRETYISRDFAQIVTLHILGLTNLPLPCMRDILGENNLNVNHLKFQDTHMYLLNSVRLVKAFAIIHSSCDCTLP